MSGLLGYLKDGLRRREDRRVGISRAGLNSDVEAGPGGRGIDKHLAHAAVCGMSPTRSPLVHFHLSPLELG